MTGIQKPPARRVRPWKRFEGRQGAERSGRTGSVYGWLPSASFHCSVHNAASLVMAEFTGTFSGTPRESLRLGRCIVFPGVLRSDTLETVSVA